MISKSWSRYYNQFVDVIVRDRKLTREQVVAIGDGRVFTGRKAKEYGLVDQLGDLASAAKLASELAGKGGRYDLVYPREKRSSLFDLIIQNAARTIRQNIFEQVQKKREESVTCMPVTGRSTMTKSDLIKKNAVAVLRPYSQKGHRPGRADDCRSMNRALKNDERIESADSAPSPSGRENRAGAQSEVRAQVALGDRRVPFFKTAKNCGGR